MMSRMPFVVVRPRLQYAISTRVVSRLSHFHVCNHPNLYTKRTISSSSKSNNRISTPTRFNFNFDPYEYTSGRWLRRDAWERAARHLTFDFDALCRRILALCPGAIAITDCQKMEGGFNRVFIFTVDNARRIVARLPFGIAGPARLTTSSEVATIRYLQDKTSIPIPRVLDWSADAQEAGNRVGSEYIIMEHAVGVPLYKQWPQMSGDRKVRCIDAICRQIKQMVDLDFPMYGSLYYTEQLAGSSSKYPLDGGFCIGPHCGTRYWDCSAGESRYYHDKRPNHGPWQDMSDYCDGLIDAGVSRIPPSPFEAAHRPSYHGSIKNHKLILEHGRAVLKAMAADARIKASSKPVLVHPDLHTRNIFVSEDDPTVITGIIDWQGASIEPAFWYSDERPDFATPTESPDDVCARAFDVCSQFLTPVLFGPRSIDEGFFRPFHYSYRTWTDGVVALRHELIETARHWESLGFAGRCPFPLPTAKELAEHDKEYRLFEAAQHLRRDLANLLDTASDGWMPPENWEKTNLAHREIFDGMLQAVMDNQDLDDEEPVRDEATLRSIWPFDLQ